MIMFFFFLSTKVKHHYVSGEIIMLK